MFATWRSTVRTLSTSSAAISAFERPEATRRITSRSRAVSPAGSDATDGTPAPSSRASAAARSASYAAPSSRKASRAPRGLLARHGIAAAVAEQEGQREARTGGVERCTALPVKVAGVLEKAACGLGVPFSAGERSRRVGGGRPQRHRADLRRHVAELRERFPAAFGLPRGGGGLDQELEAVDPLRRLVQRNAAQVALREIGRLDRTAEIERDRRAHERRARVCLGLGDVRRRLVEPALAAT